MIGRIGYVTTDFKPQIGGQEVYIRDLQQQLAPLAKEQIVFQLDNSDLNPWLEHDPSLVLIPRLPGRWRWNRRWNLYGFNWHLKKRAIRQRLAECDLLIVSYPFHWPPVAWHPRVIVISHGVDWHQPPRRWAHRRRRRIAQRCDREVLALVANTSDFWREVGRDIPPKTHMWEPVAARRWFLPNGVDIERFSPAVKPVLPDRLRLLLSGTSGEHRPYILMARNASPHRGIHLGIEVMGRFADDYSNVALVIAGTPPKGAYAKQLDQMARSFGIADRVHFVGHIPHEQMPSLYREAAINLVPTIRNEGMSRAAVEGMACGTATISTNVGGLADLPTVQTAPEAASLTHTLLKVFPDRERIGAKQCAYVHERFPLARWGEAWRSVVAEVMRLPVGKRSATPGKKQPSASAKAPSQQTPVHEEDFDTSLD